jgi:ribokinase
VQAGDGGNLLVWREGEHWLPKLPVKSIDATGAGDAFAAALAEAGTFANAAALKTTGLGAQAALLRRAAVLALLAETSPAATETFARRK